MFQCESACGADALCDEVTPGTGRCDANCVFSFRTCNTALDLSPSSINIGQTATGTTASLSSTVTEDWLKVTANAAGKLRVTLTHGADNNFDLYVYDACGGNLKCSNTATGSTTSCSFDASTTIN